MRHGRGSRSLYVAVIVAALLGGCGSDDDDAAISTDAAVATTLAVATSTTSEVTTTKPSATTDQPDVTSTDATTTSLASGGCGDDAAVDLTNYDADRPVARCAPGFPEPQPLAEPATIKVGSYIRLEQLSQLLLADALGEFEKENLTVEIEQVPQADGLQGLAAGTLDVYFTDWGIQYLNAIKQGFPLRAVMGGYFSRDADDTSVPQTGLWCRREIFSDPANPDPTELNGKTIATAGVPPTAGVMYMLGSLGLDIASLNILQIPGADAPQALQNKAVDCSSLGTPLFVPLSEDPDNYVLMSTLSAYPTAGYVLGERLLDDDRDIGLAFVRAMIRTTNTHLEGDYHQDAAVVNALAEILTVEPAQITAVKAITFDWEIREGSMLRTAEGYVDLGVLDAAPPEEDLVDRSLVADVVGATR